MSTPSFQTRSGEQAQMIAGNGEQHRCNSSAGTCPRPGNAMPLCDFPCSKDSNGGVNCTRKAMIKYIESSCANQFVSPQNELHFLVRLTSSINNTILSFIFICQTATPFCSLGLVKQLHVFVRWALPRVKRLGVIAPFDQLRKPWVKERLE